MENNWEVIFWDFDGVILESNQIRDKGFVEVLADFPKEQVDQLLEFHHKNGGLSRYVKFRHFYENILNESITDEKVQELADQFSVVMKKLLVNPKLLIQETVRFIQGNSSNFKMHIVSGSDQKELRFLCKSLEIDENFLSIHGSPTHKNDLVKDLLSEHNYDKSKCILIGDSINDFNAAEVNGISFMAYNNSSLNQYTNGKIEL